VPTRTLIITLIVGLVITPCGTSLAKSSVIQESQQRFHPVIAQNAIVAAQEAVAARIGRDILKKGGNAVDAAVAVGFAMAVTLPIAGNLGGGGFMLIWLKKQHKAIAIDYREKAPLAASRDMFLDKEGNIDKDKLSGSYLSAGVPGTVAGLTLALEKYGTMTLQQVLQPAIDLAQNGVQVTSGLSKAITNANEWLGKSDESKKIFFKANGSPYLANDLFIQSDLAHTLVLIQKNGAKGFYEGETANKIVAAMKKNEGLISLKDLSDYKAEIVEPIEGKYHDYTIISMPPPSSGGVILVELLNILEGFPLEQQGLNSAETIHELIESMNYAYNDRNYYLGDPRFVKMPIARLISKTYATGIRNKINVNKHTPSMEISKVGKIPNESNQTTHFSILDKDGNMVANTYTLNFSFGNGYTVPGAGFLLNNEMADFAAKPGEADAYGLVEGENNVVAPGKRPLSSMSPTIVLYPNGEAFLATGTPGGSRIITSVLQFIINVIDFHLNIASATSMPRVHSQLWPDQISYEQGISPDTIKLLLEMGHECQRVNAMGSLQSVELASGKKYGASDPRRMGAMAVGY